MKPVLCLSQKVSTSPVHILTCTNINFQKETKHRELGLQQLYSIFLCLSHVKVYTPFLHLVVVVVYKNNFNNGIL